MGNKSSKGSGTDHFAEWRSDSECGHSRSEYKVNEIRWIRVPMANDFARGAAEAGREVAGIATQGVSTWFNGGIKDLSHECIEIRTTCQCCGCNHVFTAEIKGENETYFRCGYYSREYNARHTYKPSSMMLPHVEEKYNEMSSSYNFVFNNCSHWCSELWDKL